MEVEGERLCLRLRGLVDVARRQRRGLVGGRVLDMAMDAHGRGVDEASHTRPRRGIEQTRRPLYVHRSVVSVGMARGTVDGRHVDDRVHSLHETVERAHVGQVALDPGRLCGERGPLRRATGQGPNGVAPAEQNGEQAPPGIPGRAGERDLHPRSSRNSAA